MHYMLLHAALLVVLACSSVGLAQDNETAPPAAADPPLEALGSADAPDEVDEETGALSLPMGHVGPGVPAFAVRPGYRVTRASTPGLIHDARFLAAGPRRTLFVAERANGSIALLRDENRDGVYDTAVTFVKDRPGVHAVQYSRGWLYFATPTTIERARDTDGDLIADDIETVVSGLPAGGAHDWRAMLVTRRHVYTAIGDSGNITEETLGDRQKIWRYSLAGGERMLWSTGIRNTEKLQVRPGTRQLWGIDHGSDWFGKHLGEGAGVAGAQPITDLHPPDEFNRYDAGGFYGHPFVTAPRIPRYEFMQRADILELAAKTIPPRWLFGAHWAANGWTFLSRGNNHFPEDHRGDAFVACHGSWNSSARVGYRIERVLFDPWTGSPYGSLLIVETLAQGTRDVLARPVDVIEAHGGTLIFSSDAPEHALYRISWESTEPEPAPEPPAPQNDTNAPAEDDL